MIKLEKYDTALLMVTKNHNIKLKYNYDKDFVFNDNLLNEYKEIAIVYADSRALPLESVRLEYVAQAMIEIYSIIEPNKMKDLLIYLLKHSYKKENISEAIFKEVYGRLQALTMIKDNEEIYELDYSLLLTNKKEY